MAIAVGRLNPKLDAPAELTEAMSRAGDRGHWWMDGSASVDAREALNRDGAKPDGGTKHGFKTGTYNAIDRRFLSFVYIAL